LALNLVVISVSAEGRIAIPVRGENRTLPSGSRFGNQTTAVRLNLTYYRSRYGSAEQRRTRLKPCLVQMGRADEELIIGVAVRDIPLRIAHGHPKPYRMEYSMKAFRQMLSTT
jgi:hypothetical protein